MESQTREKRLKWNNGKDRNRRESKTENNGNIQGNKKCSEGIKNKKTEEFWTERGLRQGCPLSQTLFNIYIVDLEEKMEKDK